ncbi:hypothetical protein TRIATDRAFT_221642 [Trichoderma atroviride IMI 206040]|uniref:Zn(2)-C6 fungal-type domain-containing protein n=2 Tax=Hypocrea atroviridis TaxID=63577 RepID=G9NWD9_HYPAI|nr:uncharacterized protein TRIATDRAFT_221642 [Trichoderma atroviride IMI 206040]EHK45299.1 hypothetical protein TRIATDRAFT_221642 [Trichoderma atroviride IMI 206040]
MDRINADGGSAASRQKSCNACVRGKRRCDKRTPRCTRCAAKGLDCVYQRQPQQQPQQSQQQHPQQLQHQHQQHCATPEMPPEFDMSFDIESLSTTTGTNTSPESLQQDAGMGLGCDPHSHHPHADLGFSIVDLMNGTGTGDGGLWDLSGFGDSDKMDLPPVPIAPSLQTEQPQSSQSQHLQPPQPIRDLSILQNEDQCITADVCQVHDPRSKIGFIVKAISDMYRDFAQRREAPFLHPRLWSSQLPKTILTAFSAATAYSSQTPQTKGWTLKVLLDAVREVHRDGERATTHADRLARVQALLVLNSMRIFDGDLGMRAAAEREMSVFLSWVKDLIAVKNELEEGLPASAHMLRDKPPKSWDSWIMVECTRRTIMISFAIMCLVFVLKSEEAPPEFWEDGHSFTASRHLWEATSSVDFFRAWREKPQYCVTDMSFKEFWMYARPDDMDEFTRLMLTTQVGIDAVEHFMAGETNIPVPP